MLLLVWLGCAEPTYESAQSACEAMFRYECECEQAQAGSSVQQCSADNLLLHYEVECTYLLENDWESDDPLTFWSCQAEVAQTCGGLLPIVCN